VNAVEREVKGVLPATSATRSGTWGGESKEPEFEEFEDSGTGLSEPLRSRTSSRIRKAATQRAIVSVRDRDVTRGWEP